MKRVHPSWCEGTEPPNHDHISPILQASEPTDSADIKIYMEELWDTGHPIRLLFLQFTEDSETEVYPLLIPQANRLMETMSRLLTQVEPALG